MDAKSTTDNPNHRYKYSSVCVDFTYSPRNDCMYGSPTCIGRGPSYSFGWKAWNATSNWYEQPRNPGPGAYSPVTPDSRNPGPAFTINSRRTPSRFAIKTYIGRQDGPFPKRSSRYDRRNPMDDE